MKQFIEFLIRVNENQLNKRDLHKLEGIALLREKLFYSVLFVFLFVGFIAYLPGVIQAYKGEHWDIIIIDSVVYFSLFAWYFINRIPTKVKIFTLLLLLYVLGIFLMINQGPYSAGLIWLLAFSIIASIFLDFKQSLYAVLLNASTIVIIGLAIKFKVLNTLLFTDYSLLAWTAIAINLFVVNIISRVSVIYFIRGLEKTGLNEQTLKEKLKKKSERLINAKMKAEESDLLKSAFLSNISHEFRTPMNAILGFTEIMLYTESSEEKRVKYLENIQSSGEQLLQIIHNTIEYSKIEMGTIEFDPEKVGIRHVFERLYEQHKTIVPQGVEFEYTMNNSEKEGHIVTDREKLSQIFSNLITNAFKFTYKGKVSYGQLESDQINFYKFFVKDTGIGIREEKQKDIFTSFHKEDNFREGTGLGLSISATLIAHMGGRIWLDSEPYKGTTFYFTLPKDLTYR